MFEYKVVSRKDLFNNELPNAETGEDPTYELPSGLEIVEIDVRNNQSAEKEGDDQVSDEFDFPLFSFGAVGNIGQPENGDDGRGLTEAPLVKISLREPSSEFFVQERPRSYYFTDYSKEDRDRFKDSAIESDLLLREAKLGPNMGWPKFRGFLLDVKEHNEHIVPREARCKKRRPGKKQRLARKAGSQNEKDREEKDKEIRRMIKKKFHKRGGKKNKKLADKIPSKDAIKPKV